MEELPKESKILDSLLNKADLKHSIYEKTHEAFTNIKEELQTVSDWIKLNVTKSNANVEIFFKDKGEFEAQLKFAGDTLFFIMHTNIFKFPPEHFMHNTSYVKQDPSRSFCGMILIYNFLSDSIKYNRINDLGYLLGRIFINKDGHYFMQGKRQYSFLHRDFAKLVFDKKAVRSIVESAIIQAVEFDLFVPPADQIQEITLLQKIQSTGNIALKTGKRMGFELIDKVENDED